MKSVKQRDSSLEVDLFSRKVVDEVLYDDLQVCLLNFLLGKSSFKVTSEPELRKLLQHLMFGVDIVLQFDDSVELHLFLLCMSFMHLFVFHSLE